MVNVKAHKRKGKKLMQDFMQMRNIAEIRALSKLSLERPLNDVEYKRMMALSRDVGLKK